MSDFRLWLHNTDALPRGDRVNLVIGAGSSGSVPLRLQPLGAESEGLTAGADDRQHPMSYEIGDDVL